MATNPAAVPSASLIFRSDGVPAVMLSDRMLDGSAPHGRGLARAGLNLRVRPSPVERPFAGIAGIIAVAE
jgi:hypothetical protein